MNPAEVTTEIVLTQLSEAFETVKDRCFALEKENSKLRELVNKNGLPAGDIEPSRGSPPKEMRACGKEYAPNSFDLLLDSWENYRWVI